MAKGQKELKKFKLGEKLTRAESMRAKCFECNGESEGKNQDCEVETCPLYFYRLYPNKVPDLKTSPNNG